jgi:uncharacterized membrane protein YsdA (DUF1294 family)/cold shock CspA family protein
MRTKGKLTTWNDEKGFGYITPNSGGKPIFVHITAFANRNRRPELNQLVTYALSSDEQGRPRAINATLSRDRLSQTPKLTTGSLPIMTATLFLFIVAIAVHNSKIPPSVLAFYVVASLLTFIMYAVDKSAARNGAWRTKESTLHLLSLAGGWPGALIAQEKLRHKTRKSSFRIAFWITVVLNCGIFIWLFTPAGGATLRALLARVV